MATTNSVPRMQASRLAGEAAREGAVRQPQDLQGPVRRPGRKQGVKHLPALAGQALFLQQDVKGEDQSDDKGADAANHAHHQAAAGGEQAPAPGLGQADGLLGQALPIDGQTLHHILDLGQILLQPHQLLLQTL